MNLNYIKYLSAIKKYGSITKASQNLFISQPNVSKAIKSLEEELNMRILSRGTGGSSLTADGVKFLEEVEPLIGQLDSVFEKYRNPQAGTSATIATIASSLFDKAVLVARSKNHLDVHVQQREMLELIDAVSMQNDLYGIIYFPTDLSTYFNKLFNEKKIKIHPILTHNMNILTSQENKLDADSLTDENLAKQTYLFYETLCEDSLAYEVSPFLRKFVLREDKKVLKVSDRISEYMALQMLPNTITLATKLPEEILEQYKLKLIPLHNTSVEFLLLHKETPIHPNVLTVINEFKQLF